MKPGKLPLLELLKKKYPQYTGKELYSIIMCGEIKISGETVRDPRRMTATDAEIKLVSRKWVSRGGEKLDHALREWKIDVAGKVVIDAGASTGGFTDCLLHRGASIVYSVDVGYNQLDYNLRKDSRVVAMERTNIMSVGPLEPVPDFAVADLSFRSITGAASHILGLTSGNLLIALVKPQFEIPETEGFDGVIRDSELLVRVVRNTAADLEKEGVGVGAVLQSPIKGTKGNTEYLFMLKKSESIEGLSNEAVIDAFLKTL